MILEHELKTKVRLNKPASEAQLQKAETEMGFPFPPQLRALYADYDGISQSAAGKAQIPFRLLPLKEVNQLSIQLAKLPIEEMPVAYTDYALRFFWTDDNSNYAGVFLDGPFIGMVGIWEHDDGVACAEAPVFRDVDSFRFRVAEAGFINKKVVGSDPPPPKGFEQAYQLAWEKIASSKRLSPTMEDIYTELPAVHERLVAAGKMSAEEVGLTYSTAKIRSKVGDVPYINLEHAQEISHRDLRYDFPMATAERAEQEKQALEEVKRRLVALPEKPGNAAPEEREWRFLNYCLIRLTPREELLSLRGLLEAGDPWVAESLAEVWGSANCREAIPLLISRGDLGSLISLYLQSDLDERTTMLAALSEDSRNRIKFQKSLPDHGTKVQPSVDGQWRPPLKL